MNCDTCGHEDMERDGISRRSFLKLAIGTAGMMTLSGPGGLLSPLPAEAVSAPPLASCGTWGAKPPKASITMLASRPRMIIIHHTATPNSTDYSRAHAYQLARNIQQSHFNRGWIDSGQNLTISRGGYVMEGRHRSLEALASRTKHVVGAHCAKQNSVAVGIENEGTYTSVLPPTALWNRLVETCAYICQQYGINPSAIYGHRDFNATLCPGDKLYAQLPKLRQAVAARLGSPSPVPQVVGMGSTSTGQGYWLAASDGAIFRFGDAGSHGSMGGKYLARPIVGMAATPSGKGYWLAGADGGIFAFGDAPYRKSLPELGVRPAAPIVGMAATPTGQGYWLVGSDGGVFSFGDAPYRGSVPQLIQEEKMGRLSAPVAGIARTRIGTGYWLAAKDGGVFSFGDARFYGSRAGTRLNAPIVGIAPTRSGAGYWLVAGDGGVFTHGDAQFYGSMGGKALNAPVVGMVATPTGKGYWLVAADGGIFNYGDAPFKGSKVSR